jgi:murein L,D-transpeptidase YafK
LPSHWYSGSSWANWPDSQLPPNTVAERLVVRKSARRLDLYANGKVAKSYAIAVGKNPIGRKEHEGDGRTPEGSYVIDFKKARSSCCYRSLHISYPDAADRARAPQARPRIREARS